jgi:hypothetical protein
MWPLYSLLFFALSHQALSMNSVHTYHDNHSFDFLILTGNTMIQAVARQSCLAEQVPAPRKETMMHTHGHTTVWGTHIGIGRGHKTRSWYQQLRDWWTAHRATRQQANIEALNRCWDATRETVTPQGAEAAPEMAAAHHAISVATMLYGLSS